MKSRNRYQTAVMLLPVALALWLVVSCGPSHTPLLPYEEAASQWDANVDDHIADSKRAENLKELGRRLSELQKSLSVDIASLTEKAMALNEGYDTTREDVRQLVADFAKKRNAALEEYRDIIFAMRKEVSAKEWKALME